MPSKAAPRNFQPTRTLLSSRMRVQVTHVVVVNGDIANVVRSALHEDDCEQVDQEPQEDKRKEERQQGE